MRQRHQASAPAAAAVPHPKPSDGRGRGRRSQTLRGGLHRSCATATATATAQARLRRALSVSWGAKRSRTVRSGPALGSRWRDWAGLDEGPAGLIADRVLANDVADYVRFRAACLPWRRCCADPRARGVLEDPRLYPRHWIMLRDDYEELATAAAPHGIRRRFLNTSTGQCIQADIPELRDHGIFRATAEGLLVMHCKQTEAVRLLNPLTRQMGLVEFSLGCIGECMSCCASLLDHSTVFLYFYGR